MGRMGLVGMLEVGGDTDAVLDWHLRFNHFPPILDGVRFARAAMQAVQEGRGDEPVHDEASERHAPSAWDVVESWHLDEFLDSPEDE
jgi:hypothetical protein